jgi:glycosyltransferase involved in cell wall biosynthesis
MTTSANRTPGVATHLPHRPLFLQHASIFEQFGGVEYYLDDFIRLANAEYQGVCTVVPTSKTITTARHYRWEGVPRAQSRWLRKIQNRFFGGLYRRAGQLIREVKPTFIFNAHVSLGPLCYLLGKQTGLPVVTCVYGIDAWGDLFPQDEWCLRRSERIISISHWTKKILVDRGYDPEKIDIVHPLLPANFEPAPRAKVKTRDALTLLSVSRLDASEQYKGQDHVLRALAQLRNSDPQLRFHYIIQGEGSDRPRLETLTRALGIEATVEFRNSIRDREALREVYQEADLFIMPSRFGKWDGSWKGEGFGIVYVEAASMEVPSLAYDCGGATDIIRHGETGWLVEPDQIGGIAATLRTLAQNPERLRQTGEKARAWVLRAFTTQPVTHQIERAFDRVRLS